MPKVDRICQVIIQQFRLKARLWQINILVDITYKKKDVCAIVSINISKSLIYEVIPVVMKGLILVILSIIAFIKDQVRVSS